MTNACPARAVSAAGGGAARPHPHGPRTGSEEENGARDHTQLPQLPPPLLRGGRGSRTFSKQGEALARALPPAPNALPAAQRGRSEPDSPSPAGRGCQDTGPAAPAGPGHGWLVPRLFPPHAMPWGTPMPTAGKVAAGQGTEWHLPMSPRGRELGGCDPTMKLMAARHRDG